MKVIRDCLSQTTQKKTKECRCVGCSSIIEIDFDEDIQPIPHGFGWICPICNEENCIDEITVTKDNINFPANFFEYNAADSELYSSITPDEVQKFVKKAISELRDNKNEDNYGMWMEMGKHLLLAKRWPGDECYSIYVADNYYDCEIPFEEDDYIENEEEDLDA